MTAHRRSSDRTSGAGRSDPSRQRLRGSDDPEPVGAVLEELFRARPFSAGVSLGRIAREWPRIVGDRLSKECRPVRLDGGVLVIEASSAAWGAQIRFLAREIVGRIGSVVRAPVGDIRVTVDPRPAAS